MCGCNKPKASATQRERPESFAVTGEEPVLAPGEVLVTWKAPSKRHIYRGSTQRGRRYDQLTAGPFPMLERDVERYKNEIERLAPAVSPA